MEISSPQEMNAAPLRFCCLVPGCRANKDFSLITLFEHLNYHVKDKNLTSFFEYKCLSCPAFFTNKIFMFDHKRCYPHHRIEHIPCLDLDTPNNDPQLCEAFNLITASYLRHMFAVSGQNGAISRNFHQIEPPKTPTYSRDGYEPRTPFYNDFRQRDFSNSCVNANLPRTPSAPQGNELAAKNFANQLDGIMLSSIPEDWKQSIVSQMVPFLNGSNPFSQEADVGRGTRARDNMDSGGRDSFGSRDGPPRSGSNFNDRFETNGGGGSSDRPRGSGRGGDSDRPRGCFNRGKEGHHVSDCPDPRKPRFGADGDGFSSRGDGRGRGGDRHSSRGRGGDRGGGRRGGFRGGRSGGADRNRSRSRSPRRSSPPARRSYSRSRSPPSNRSDTKRKSLSRDRSFSRSPQSD